MLEGSQECRRVAAAVVAVRIFRQPIPKRYNNNQNPSRRCASARGTARKVPTMRLSGRNHPVCHPICRTLTTPSLLDSRGNRPPLGPTKAGKAKYKSVSGGRTTSPSVFPSITLTTNRTVVVVVVVDVFVRSASLGDIIFSTQDCFGWSKWIVLSSPLALHFMRSNPFRNRAYGAVCQ